MTKEEFIALQLMAIKNGFSLSRIRNNVYRYVFRLYAGNITIDAMIDMCMELYAEIIKSINQ